MIPVALAQLVRPAQTAVRYAPFSASAALWKEKTVTQEDATSKLHQLQEIAPNLYAKLLSRIRGIELHSPENAQIKELQSRGFIEKNGEIGKQYADVLYRWLYTD